MKCRYTGVTQKIPKRTSEKCKICGRFQNIEDIKHGCEKCIWQKDGVDVVTPYWIKYHESKGHKKISPSQYRV